MVMNQFFFIFFFFSFFLMASTAFANVVLLGKNVTLSFEDIEANFGECFFFLNFVTVYVVIYFFVKF